VLMKNIENFLAEIGEAYVDSIKLFYSKNRRVFYKKDGKELVINDVKMLPNGDVEIDNDVGSIQKCRVVVSLSPKSPNSQFTKRMTHMDILNLLYKDQINNIELIGFTQGKILETIPCDDAEEKEREQMIMRRNQLGKQKMDAMLALPPPGQGPQKPATLSVRYADLEPEARVEALKKLGLNTEQTQPGQPPAAPQNAPAPHQQAAQNLQEKLSPLTAHPGIGQGPLAPQTPTTGVQNG
jgi:hypothetical protein